MRNSSPIVLVIVFVIALGVALSLGGRSDEDTNPRTTVLVAASDIAAGSFVRATNHLSYVAWPEDKITEAMLTSGNSKLSDFEGSVARVAIQKGAPILNKQLVKSNEGGFMSAVLEAGKRAVSIAVDATTGNAGFIFPGDRVDLILTVSVNQGAQASRASETFIENVRVLAIDQMMGNLDNKAVLAKTVTLEVTPKQAEEINVAKDLGKISLSLRSLASEKAPEVAAPPSAATEAVSFDDVLRNAGGQTPNAAMPIEQGVTRDTDVSRIITPQGVSGSVRVIRGSEAQVIQFNGDAGRSEIR